MSWLYSSSGFTSLGAFCTSPIENLYVESNKPSLYVRREKLSLQYTTKLAANPKNPAYNCVFNPKYERFYNEKPMAIKPLVWEYNHYLNRPILALEMFNLYPFHRKSHGHRTLQKFQNKTKKLPVLLLVLILRTALDYLTVSSIFTADTAVDIALYHIRDQPEKQFIIYSDSFSILRSRKSLDHENPLIQQILRKYDIQQFLLAFQPH